MERTFTMTDNEIMIVMTALAEMTHRWKRGIDESGNSIERRAYCENVVAECEELTKKIYAQMYSDECEVVNEKQGSN